MSIINSIIQPLSHTSALPKRFIKNHPLACAFVAIGAIGAIATITARPMLTGLMRAHGRALADVRMENTPLSEPLERTITPGMSSSATDVRTENTPLSEPLSEPLERTITPGMSSSATDVGTENTPLSEPLERTITPGMSSSATDVGTENTPLSEPLSEPLERTITPGMSSSETHVRMENTPLSEALVSKALERLITPAMSVEGKALLAQNLRIVLHTSVNLVERMTLEANTFIAPWMTDAEVEEIVNNVGGIREYDRPLVLQAGLRASFFKTQEEKRAIFEAIDGIPLNKRALIAKVIRTSYSYSQNMGVDGFKVADIIKDARKVPADQIRGVLDIFKDLIREHKTPPQEQLQLLKDMFAQAALYNEPT
jgi:hypothetical protein